MPYFADYEIELVMNDFDHALTLQTLSQRREATDLDAAHTTQGIAQELGIVEKYI